MKKRKTEQEWRQIVEGRKGTGEPVDKYCRRHGVSEQSYYNWKRRLKPAGDFSQGPEFLEVIKAGGASGVSLVWGGWRIELEKRFDGGALRTALEAVNESQSSASQR